MAFLEGLRPLGQKIMSALNTPIPGTGEVRLGATNVPPDLKPILTLTIVERIRQEAILAARVFHEGYHHVPLTPRLKEFLGRDDDQFALRFNLAKKVATATSDRLVPCEVWQSKADETKGPPDENGDRAPSAREIQAEFATAVWTASRMQGKQARTLMEAVRDGEHFLLIDYDKDGGIARLTPHQAYIDPLVSYGGAKGDGEGMGLVYPYGDVDQKPLYGYKRWYDVERKVHRIEVYKPGVGDTPGSIDKYARVVGAWRLEESEPLDPRVGLPVVHLKSPYLETAAKEAIPLQKAQNKALVDLLASSDANAFRIIFAKGWKAVDKNGKAYPITPGVVMGTENKDAALQVVEGADLGNQISVLDKFTALMADVSNTPLSLLNRSSQRAAEGTLQEERDEHNAKVRAYSVTFSMGFEDAMKIARRFQNVYGGGWKGEQLDDVPPFKLEWQPFTMRSAGEEANEAAALKARVEARQAASQSNETIWKEEFGMSQADIEAEYEAQAMGGELWRGPAEGSASEGATAPPAATEGHNISPNAEPGAGVVTSQTLNGAQITAALDVMQQLSQGSIGEIAGVELLVAVGLPRDKAEKMSSEAIANKQAPPTAPPVGAPPAFAGVGQ